MCKNAYIKECTRMQKNMYFCHCFDNEADEIKRLCLFQRYCGEKGEYIFNNETRCKQYE